MQASVTACSQNDTADKTSARELSRRIKDRAFVEGFEKVGVVPARVLDAAHERLTTWLERGYHAGMAWMARDPQTRTNPRKLFPEARSVVVVALNYYTPYKHAEDPATGKVSRYAWGDDYHDVVGAKLRSLLAWIKEEVPQAEGKVCVDIQPMMDKAWAVEAGLGWIGKHTNLITPEYGSWVFIGELLLNIDLEYDKTRVDDHCGSCTLCIDACPTAAINEPYVVDSNKCISYATIELRDAELPRDIAQHLEGWFYGCDICQDVCPWNRFEQVTNEDRFQPRTGNVNATLTEAFELTPQTYAQRFRGSAMKRAKLSGLQRNARALLGANGAK
ncbi:MAG TPA: tRNA epoxyqueuosine(34) reductase QueG [Blastocatellia bacterium]|jgi:epoxyqueuosine reductase|nr:tRNA epoxyqueuosine(34) reductase QueG [Blastocatellia bacterium]HAF24002.1 tRNA epoxyqueuosine(34) reductase QueG [Blastocatellia bacterium]HCX29411.1 tRNA epoxyqueuosine(34) reductase QueG [Blastocatellia bacterium]